MSAVVTEAVVLHAFDYLETSRIVRIATREAGVQSVLARGARRSRARFGTALDLFASGIAEFSARPGRDLQTLTSFDVTHSRARLASDLDRFTAAAALAEIVLRFAGDDANEPLYEALVNALDAVADAPAGGGALDAALAGAWSLLAHLGFAPSVDVCASCHAELPLDASAPFSHPSGGVLCARCARNVRASRTLPADARLALRRWLAGEPSALGADTERRAHQRLLREFLGEHMAGERPLKAFEVWESARLSSVPADAASEDAR